MSLYYFYKSTHIGKKKKSFGNTGMPLAMQMELIKKKRVAALKATNHNRVHTAASLLTCRESAARPGPPFSESALEWMVGSAGRAHRYS